MRGLFKVLSCVGFGCLAALGCADTPKRPMIRPPKEDFHVPPEGLFTKPVKYPDELLNNVKPRAPKDQNELPAGFGSNGGGMGGPSMGSPGMGAPGMGR